MYNLKIVIVGAGIGGLTSAIACRRAGYEVEIYERVSKLRPAGGGITLWPNGIKVLNMLGLGDKLAAISGRMEQMENRSHTDRQLSCINLKHLEKKVGQRPYPIARRNLQQMLLDAFGLEKVYLGRKCLAVEQDEQSVTAIFEDGTQATGDVLIGADGIRSNLREYVLGRKAQLRYANYVNWNGLVTTRDDLYDSNRWVMYVGEQKRASIMPVGGDRFSFVFGAPMPKGTTVKPEERRSELEKIFLGWPQSVQLLIQRLEPLEVNRIEIHDMDPLEHLVRGRIVLLGDAGHASTPALGQGAAQAMEDAEVLLRYLVTTNISVADALRRYEAERKQRTAALVMAARQRTNTIYGKDPEVTQQWYKHLKERDEHEVINTMAKIFVGGPFH